MPRVEKTVFISYRRSDVPWALAIFKALTHNGYDAFFDYAGIAAGDFERIIVENIKSRAHFLVLLTPSALDRCVDPDDWLRREIEEALDSKRNIVPILLNGFEFSAPASAKFLVGKLALIKKYNGLRISADFFDEAIERLSGKYLDIPSDAVLHPATPHAQVAAHDAQAIATAAPPVQMRQLTPAASSKDTSKAWLFGNKWVRMILIAGAAGAFALAAALGLWQWLQPPVTVTAVLCEGQYPNSCPFAHNAFTPCYTVEAWANAWKESQGCLSRPVVKQVFSVNGNQCGYSRHEVSCQSRTAGRVAR